MSSLGLQTPPRTVKQIMSPPCSAGCCSTLEALLLSITRPICLRSELGDASTCHLGYHMDSHFERETVCIACARLFVALAINLPAAQVLLQLCCYEGFEAECGMVRSICDQA